jgi:cytosylglucuronate decarboxylase
MSTPPILIIRLLEACDAGCFMCSFARSCDPYRLSGVEAQELASSIEDTGVKLVRFTGGEPLLHDEIHAVVGSFSSRGKLTSIITNGGRLEEEAKGLAASGLAQVVVSLDAPDPAAHDRFRQTPGLFVRATDGLRAMRLLGVRTRVNTVAGPHNIGQLPRMFDVLAELGVDDWSIIPLKAADGAWRYPDPGAARIAQREFQAYLREHRGPPRLIGYSSQWMGRNEREERQYLEERRSITPSGRCGAVDLIRYLAPKTREAFPCNCVPHRTDGLELATELDLGNRTWLGGSVATDWLRENGARVCRGCEPANAALGDGVVDLTVDPFGF